MERSTDGGRSWSAQIVVADDDATANVDPDNGLPLATGARFGNPDVAVDPSGGRLYVIWTAASAAGGHNDIAMSSSTDDGRTWSTPVKVNRTPTPVMAFTSIVDVLPNGTIGVTYYDIRHNTPDPGLPTDYFIAISSDRGRSWTETKATPMSFDDTVAPIRQGEGYCLGDYQRLATDGTAFVPTDTFHPIATDCASRRRFEHSRFRPVCESVRTVPPDRSPRMTGKRARQRRRRARFRLEAGGRRSAEPPTIELAMGAVTTLRGRATGVAANCS